MGLRARRKTVGWWTASESHPARQNNERQYQHLANAINRRTFMSRAGLGLGAVAISSLLADEGIAARAHANSLNDTTGILPGLPHFPPRVKRVIFLCMAGGPSHLETFDYKPGLEQIDGQPMPSSFTEGQPIAQLQGQELKAKRPLDEIQAARRERVDVQRLSALAVQDGRRHLHRQIHGHRTDQSRSGPHVHEYRDCDQRQAVDGFLDQLWFG